MRIPLEAKNTLARHGYARTATLGVRARRAALLRAIREFGTTYVARKLNVLYVFNRRRHPAQARIFEDDKQFVRLVAFFEKDRAPNAAARDAGAAFDAGARAPY